LRMERPEPRVALGQALRGLATSAIDLSDGLLGDLGHIMERSGVGASVDAARAGSLLAAVRAGHVLDADQCLELVLAGGDDYELAFTAPQVARDAVQAAGAQTGTPVLRIGRIEAERGVRVLDAQGQPLRLAYGGFDHFA